MPQFRELFREPRRGRQKPSPSCSFRWPSPFRPSRVPWLPPPRLRPGAAVSPPRTGARGVAEPAVTTRGNAPGDRPGHRGVVIPPAPPPPFLPERVAQILSGARDLPERDTAQVSFLHPVSREEQPGLRGLRSDLPIGDGVLSAFERGLCLSEARPGRGDPGRSE